MEVFGIPFVILRVFFKIKNVKCCTTTRDVTKFFIKILISSRHYCSCNDNDGQKERREMCCLFKTSVQHVNVADWLNINGTKCVLYSLSRYVEDRLVSIIFCPYYKIRKIAIMKIMIIGHFYMIGNFCSFLLMLSTTPSCIFHYCSTCACRCVISSSSCRDVKMSVLW